MGCLESIGFEMGFKCECAPVGSELEGCEICDLLTFHPPKLIWFNDALRLTVCLCSCPGEDDLKR